MAAKNGKTPLPNKRQRDRIVRMARAGKGHKQIARETGYVEHHVWKVMLAHDLIAAKGKQSRAVRARAREALGLSR